MINIFLLIPFTSLGTNGRITETRFSIQTLSKEFQGNDLNDADGTLNKKGKKIVVINIFLHQLKYVIFMKRKKRAKKVGCFVKQLETNVIFI